jgi:hypothetical protein
MSHPPILLPVLCAKDFGGQITLCVHTVYLVLIHQIESINDPYMFLLRPVFFGLNGFGLKNTHLLWGHPIIQSKLSSTTKTLSHTHWHVYNYSPAQLACRALGLENRAGCRNCYNINQSHSHPRNDVHGRRNKASSLQQDVSFINRFSKWRWPFGNAGPSACRGAQTQQQRHRHWRRCCCCPVAASALASPLLPTCSAGSP